ncbi:MAG TPA: exosortase/archaeosortase family protein [Verrucomicrobiae bacterium]|nr:exosortase/archaeosortase family protein [Verrucomicrobiae bacterium]
MQSAPEKPLVAGKGDAPSVYSTSMAMVLAVSVLIGLLYLPLLYWLGSTTIHTQQLFNGALLVLIALAICVRDAMYDLQPAPQISNQGIGLVALALGCLWLATHVRGGLLPLFVLSACLAFAGVVSFLFGKSGVRQFLPALGAFFVFGILAGLVPTLDWPLRAMAGRYAGSLLEAMGSTVRLALEQGQPPRLILDVKGHAFVVATECNGFGLLTSALIVATILAFQNRLRWVQKLSLVAISVPIAISFNFLRIVSICAVAPRTTLPYGFVHETLGMLFYFSGLALIWKIARRARPLPRGRTETPSPMSKP